MSKQCVLVTTKIIDPETISPLGTEISALDENGINEGIKAALKCLGLTPEGVQAFGSLKDVPFDDKEEGNFSGKKIFNFFNQEEIATAEELVENSCGLVLPGGKDTRAYEILLARIAYDKKKPILAICAGQNVLVRALGGTTKKLSDEQKIIHWAPDKHKAHNAYAVEGTELSKLMGDEGFTVNSVHSTVIDNPGELLTVLAYDEYGNIEVVGLSNFINDHFVVGTRFHPETFFAKLSKSNDPNQELKEIVTTDPVSLAIFGLFAQACRREMTKDANDKDKDEDENENKDKDKDTR